MAKRLWCERCYLEGRPATPAVVMLDGEPACSVCSNGKGTPIIGAEPVREPGKPGRKPVDVDEAKLRELLAEGRTQSEIAKTLCVSGATIHRLIAKLGIRLAYVPAPDSGVAAREASIGANLPAGFIEKHGLTDPTESDQHAESEDEPQEVEELVKKQGMEYSTRGELVKKTDESAFEQGIEYSTRVVPRSQYQAPKSAPKVDARIETILTSVRDALVSDDKAEFVFQVRPPVGKKPVVFTNYLGRKLRQRGFVCSVSTNSATNVVVVSRKMQDGKVLPLIGAPNPKAK